jgi:hypothetical protein
VGIGRNRDGRRAAVGEMGEEGADRLVGGEAERIGLGVGDLSVDRAALARSSVLSATAERMFTV